MSTPLTKENVEKVEKLKSDDRVVDFLEKVQRPLPYLLPESEGTTSTTDATPATSSNVFTSTGTDAKTRSSKSGWF